MWFSYSGFIVNSSNLFRFGAFNMSFLRVSFPSGALRNWTICSLGAHSTMHSWRLQTDTTAAFAVPLIVARDAIGRCIGTVALRTFWFVGSDTPDPGRSPLRPWRTNLQEQKMMKSGRRRCEIRARNRKSMRFTVRGRSVERLRGPRDRAPPSHRR